MKFNLEYILAVRLGALGDSSIKEIDLMDQVWEDLSLAVCQGKMLDVPFRRERNGRIISVVETLKDWICKGIVECLDEGNDKGITVKVLRPIILSLTVSAYQDFSRGGSENGSD